MSRYEILRGMPGWIERGLDDGSLQRGPGGVIRHCSGAHRGAVAAIVRAPASDSSPPNALPPDPCEGRVRDARSSDAAVAEQRAALMDAVSQVAGVVDLYGSEIGPDSIAALDVIGDMLFGIALARIDGHLHSVESAVSDTLDMVRRSLAALRDLGDLQIVAFTTAAGRGIELLQRGIDCGEKSYFVRAGERLEEGMADIKTALQTMNGEQMLENARRTQHLLRVAALCASGEMQAMALADKSFEARIASLRAHRGLWEEVRDRLRGLPGPSARLPTLSMLQTEREQGLMKTRRRWIAETARMLEILEAENTCLEAMRTIPESELRAAGNGGDPVNPTLCLVNRETAPAG